MDKAVRDQLDDALKWARRRLQDGKDLLPMLVVRTSAGDRFPLVLTTGAAGMERRQMLYVVGGTVGVAFDAREVVALTDAILRPEGEEPLDALWACHLTEDGSDAVGVQIYRRTPRLRFDPAQLTESAQPSLWEAFFDGMRNSAQVARVAGVTPGEARTRASGLVDKMKRPAKESGVLVLDPERLFSQ